MKLRTALCIAATVLSCAQPAELETPVGGSSALEGTVRLAGDAVFEPRRITNTTDPNICGKSQSLEDIVLSPERGVANAIVSVRAEPFAPPATETLVLDNVNCRFEPHAGVLTVGSTIEAHNADATLHTTHLYGPTEINFSLPIRGATGSRTLSEAGIYSVKCDVHGWMQAYVRVDPHPFHAVTDAAGYFRIDGIPLGRHTVEVWHERLGVFEQEVMIGASDSSTIELEYAP